MIRGLTIQPASLAVFLAFSFSVMAEETPSTPTKQEGTAPAGMSAEQEKMMKAMEDAGKVTENHMALDYLVGNWSTKTKWWQAPGTKPEETEGKTHFESILGGRFVRETVDGTMMGKKFQGIGYLGYDNMKKKYITLWMDSMATGVFTLEGDSPDKGKTIKSSGEFLCPITGKEKFIRSVMKKVGKNEVVYEHYEKDPGGKEFKALEVAYKRVTSG